MMRSESAIARGVLANSAVALVLGGGMLLVAGCKVTTIDPSGIPPYDECNIGRSGECSIESQGCFDVTVEGARAGLCTSECSSSSDCPRDIMGERGHCISFDGGGIFTCWEACFDSGDCQVGWACKTSAGGVSFPAMCVPT